MQANSGAVAPSYLAGILLAAVVVAALASLALIQGARDRGEVLDLVRATREFSPREGERARVRFRLRRSTDDAVVRVLHRGEPVRTLVDGESLVGDDRFYVYRWDGRSDDGEVVEPGPYRVEILLRDMDREIVPEQGRIRIPREPGRERG